MGDAEFNVVGAREHPKKTSIGFYFAQACVELEKVNEVGANGRIHEKCNEECFLVHNIHFCEKEIIF